MTNLGDITSQFLHIYNDEKDKAGLTLIKVDRGLGNFNKKIDVDLDFTSPSPTADAFALNDPVLAKVKKERGAQHIARIEIGAADLIDMAENLYLMRSFCRKIIRQGISKLDIDRSREIAGSCLLEIRRPGTHEVFRALEGGASYEMRVYTDHYYLD